MKTIHRLLLCLALLLTLTPGLAAEKGAKIRVLIIDGQNNHDWRKMTPWHKAQLEASGLFTVEVSTTPSGGAGWEN